PKCFGIIDDSISTKLYRVIYFYNQFFQFFGSIFEYERQEIFSLIGMYIQRLLQFVIPHFINLYEETTFLFYNYRKLAIVVSKTKLHYEVIIILNQNRSRRHEFVIKIFNLTFTDLLRL